MRLRQLSEGASRCQLCSASAPPSGEGGILYPVELELCLVGRPWEEARGGSELKDLGLASSGLGRMWSWLVQQLLGYPREPGDAEESIPNTTGVQVGSEERHDKTISYGYTLLRGKRSTMEDYHSAKFEDVPGIPESVGMFGVFDGHGGPDAAMYIKQHLFKNLTNHKDFTTDTEKATNEVYVNTDDSYLEDPKSRRDDGGAGSTAVTAVVIGRRLTMANVGDSRAVLCRQGKAIQVSVDHKPNEPHEKQRIEDNGGMVVWAGTWRVGGVLAVSRAFGDRPLKKYVKADPYMRSEDLTKDDEFLVLASDGLWDVVSNEEAVSISREAFNQRLPIQKVSERLAETAMNRGSNDNITCLLVRFNFKD
ncbi:unnamed protein product [Ostreobium quekettii]|uniref:protein-serine/threonine phosphatase n=1 Tax=Ostreobium quekettii TaxID=121088 RepID=A0A8S1IV61_9CHLO|nr:unnamed protein product [Ostreobium quekettii]|eukprot:evm.model.scf_171.1 EVM.evm.TU.scf_171.1   scf_171:1461-4934(-)